MHISSKKFHYLSPFTKMLQQKAMLATNRQRLVDDYCLGLDQRTVQPYGRCVFTVRPFKKGVFLHLIPIMAL
jgi:hypothetical protein